MIVTAWNNGKHHNTGAGYGVKISQNDRDQYFSREWNFVYLKLPNCDKEVEVNINKSSFWNGTCRELINKEIGKWMISSDLAPWPSNRPPKLTLDKIEKNHFILKPK